MISREMVILLLGILLFVIAVLSGFNMIALLVDSNLQAIEQHITDEELFNCVVKEIPEACEKLGELQ